MSNRFDGFEFIELIYYVGWMERPHQKEKRFIWRDGQIEAHIDGEPNYWSYTVFLNGKRHAFGVEKILSQAKYEARKIVRELGGDL